LAATPALAARLGVSVGGFGVAFVAFALGGIVGTRVAPAAVRRFGAGPATLLTGGLVSALLALRAAPTELALFLLVQTASGIADGAQDVSMNVVGVAVDRRTRRPIMNRLHGMWSIGAVAGGGIGAGLAALDASVAAHLTVAALIVATLNLISLPLLRDTTTIDTRPAEPTARWWRSRTLVLLAVMGTAASVLEGAPLDWGVLYLSDELDAPSGTAGVVAVTFTVGMVVSRFASDHLVHRFGVPIVLRVGALAAAVALATALVVDQVAVALVAWAVIGAGVAAAYPALFVAAGRAPGLPPGSGIGAVASVARVGFLLGPAMIGPVADRHGLRVALTIPLAAAAVILLLADAARRPPV
jgi:fucose permease